MGRIQPEPENGRTVVTLDLSEILTAPYYLPGDRPGAVPTYSGETIGDAIRRFAWKKMHLHARSLMQKKKFKYGDVEVVGEKVLIAFYEELSPVPDEPGGP